MGDQPPPTSAWSNYWAQSSTAPHPLAPAPNSSFYHQQVQSHQQPHQQPTQGPYSQQGLQNNNPTQQPSGSGSASSLSPGSSGQGTAPSASSHSGGSQNWPPSLRDYLKRSLASMEDAEPELKAKTEATLRTVIREAMDAGLLWTTPWDQLPHPLAVEKNKNSNNNPQGSILPPGGGGWRKVEAPHAPTTSRFDKAPELPNQGLAPPAPPPGQHHQHQHQHQHQPSYAQQSSYQEQYPSLQQQQQQQHQQGHQPQYHAPPQHYHPPPQQGYQDPGYYSAPGDRSTHQYAPQYQQQTPQTHSQYHHQQQQPPHSSPHLSSTPGGSQEEWFESVAPSSSNAIPLGSPTGSNSASWPSLAESAATAADEGKKKRKRRLSKAEKKAERKAQRAAAMAGRDDESRVPGPTSLRDSNMDPRDAGRKAERAARFGIPDEDDGSYGKKRARNSKGNNGGRSSTSGGDSHILVNDQNEDLAWDDLTVRGTSTTVEKIYLRLTSAPDPAQVRTTDTLSLALGNVMAKMDAGARDYHWAWHQLKSIRQDLTVQRIKSPLTVQVYETHARLALKEGDIVEYNQCAGQLLLLYARGLPGNKQEFTALRILYLAVTRNFIEGAKYFAVLQSDPVMLRHPAVQHAVKVRAALNSSNYHRFFKLYKEAPGCGRYVMDYVAEKVRIQALWAACKAYKPGIDAEWLSSELGWDLATLAEWWSSKNLSGLDLDKKWIDSKAALAGWTVPLPAI